MASATTAPCTIVILGAAGDLTRRKLLPAIYNLDLDGLLPERFAVMGFARRDLDDASFRKIAPAPTNHLFGACVLLEYAGRGHARRAHSDESGYWSARAGTGDGWVMGNG